MTTSLPMNGLAEPSFLRFGTWSLLLHLGTLLVFSMIHVETKVEGETPVVKVTLIENPTLQPKQEEATAGVPPLMTARPPIPWPQPSIPPLPHLSGIPETPMSISKFLPPPPTLHAERRVLQDQHAADALKLKNYLKTAQRPDTHTTTSTSAPPPLDMPALPPAMTASIPSITTVPRSSPPPIFSQSANTTILTAAPSGANGISRSKVGLGKTIPPVYPRIARESGWEGTVVVRVVVQADGTPDVIQIRKSSGHQVLDDAATDALKNWQFVPAKDGNIPIRSIVEIPINFDLRKQG